MMFLPELVPKTVEELVSAVDEEAALLALEAELEAQYISVRELGKDSEPLGLVKTQCNLEESDPDDDVDEDDVAGGDDEGDMDGGATLFV
jgi:hypothetical protein